VVQDVLDLAAWRGRIVAVKDDAKLRNSCDVLRSFDVRVRKDWKLIISRESFSPYTPSASDHSAGMGHVGKSPSLLVIVCVVVCEVSDIIMDSVAKYNGRLYISVEGAVQKVCGGM
jgi:hypothetical protein